MCPREAVLAEDEGSCPACGAAGTDPYRSAFPVPLRRCPTCGSAHVHPLPTAEALQERYVEEHAAGKWADIFARPLDAVWPERARLLVGWAGGRPGRVLDVGCGDGRFLAAAREVGWRVVGLEVAHPPLVAARDRAGAAPVIQGTLDAVGPGPAFDAVTFWDVLEHVPDPLRLLAQARSLLRPGGVVAATMPNATGLTARLQGPHWGYYDLDEYGHLHHLGPRGLTALFRRAGLEVTHVATHGAPDLRDLPRLRWGATPGPLATGFLDRLSGITARLLRPTRLGNTLTVVGRR